MKITKKQLRKLILQEMDKTAYGRGMDQQDAIASKASFPAADEVIEGLLMVVGNDDSFEAQEQDQQLKAFEMSIAQMSSWMHYMMLRVTYLMLYDKSMSISHRGLTHENHEKTIKKYNY